MRAFLKTCLLFVAVSLLAAVTTIGPAALSGFLSAFRDTTPSDVHLPSRATPESDRSHEERIALDAVNDVSRDRLAATIEAYSRIESRIPGYPGHEEAFGQVRTAFHDLGYHTWVDTFDVTVPIDHGGRLVVPETGEAIPVHALWPNDVQPPTLPEGGVSGPLVYGRGGSLAELSGHQIDGSIVLLHFDSEKAYLQARVLGAEAILFFDNGGVSRPEADHKTLRVPADIPRYWVDRTDAAALIERAGRNVHLDARMTWREVPAWNLIASTDPNPFGSRGESDPDLVVVGSYYDAISVVPAIAPGAESAIGLAATLEIARTVRTHPPTHDVAFLVTGAHFQGLRGAFDFVYRHARGPRRNPVIVPEHRKLDFDLFLGIDLSSEGDRIVCLPHGMLNNFEYKTDATALAVLRRPSERLVQASDTLVRVGS